MVIRCTCCHPAQFLAPIHLTYHHCPGMIFIQSSINHGHTCLKPPLPGHWHVALACSNMACILCRHLTCPVGNTSCPLCQQNPNRRCQLGNNFAAKQLEKQSLVSACGSSITISLKHSDRSWRGTAESCSSSSPAAVQDGSGICLEV